jgi:hypothetical protein
MIHPRKTKCKIPNAKRASPREVFHVPTGLHAAFLCYIRAQSTEVDKSAVLRRALRELLEREGYWPASSGGGLG